MSEKPGYKSSDDKKSARIDFLERQAKWHLYTLELLASLGELHRSASQERDPDKIFQIAREHLVKILNFNGMAFYLVAEPDSEFALRYVWPDNLKEEIVQEVDLRINDGSFSWAVNQNRSVVLQSSKKDRNLVLHVLSTQQRVRGMFVGFVPSKAPYAEQNLHYTISIVLQNTANALESAALYNLFKATNSHIEKKVRERTSDLEDHMLKMEEEIRSRKLAEESLWEARQAAESALRFKSDWMALFGNELSVPVRSLVAYADFIRAEMKDPDSESLNEKFKALQAVGEYTLKLIGDIQNLAHLQSGSPEAKPENILIEGLLEEIHCILYPLAHEHECTIEIGSLKNAGQLVSDKSRLRQVLLKILGNACRFSNHNNVHVECIPENREGMDWVCFRITDQGPGIEPGLLEDLLEKSSEVDGISLENQGNGYQYLHSQCRLLGGEIQMDSELGKGTTVNIFIPREFSGPRFRPISLLRKGESLRPESSSEEMALSGKERTSGSRPAQKTKNRDGKQSRNWNVWVFDEDLLNSRILCKILNDEGWATRALKPSLQEIEFHSPPDLVIIGFKGSSASLRGFMFEWVQSDVGKDVPILLYATQDVSKDQLRPLPEQVKGILHRGNITREELIGEIEEIKKMNG